MRKFLCVFVSFLVAKVTFIALFILVVRYYPFNWEYSDHMACILGVLLALLTIATLVAYFTLSFLEQKFCKKKIIE